MNNANKIEENMEILTVLQVSASGDVRILVTAISFSITTPTSAEHAIDVML